MYNILLIFSDTSNLLLYQDQAFEKFVEDTSNERITYDYDKICLCNTDLCSIHDESDSSGTERLAVQHGFVIMTSLLFGIHVNYVNVI